MRGHQHVWETVAIQNGDAYQRCKHCPLTQWVEKTDGSAPVEPEKEDELDDLDG